MTKFQLSKTKSAAFNNSAEAPNDSTADPKPSTTPITRQVEFTRAFARELTRAFACDIPHAFAHDIPRTFDRTYRAHLPKTIYSLEFYST